MTMADLTKHITLDSIELYYDADKYYVRIGHEVPIYFDAEKEQIEFAKMLLAACRLYDALDLYYNRLDSDVSTETLVEYAIQYLEDRKFADEMGSKNNIEEINISYATIINAVKNEKIVSKLKSELEYCKKRLETATFIDAEIHWKSKISLIEKCLGIKKNDRR